MFCFREKRSLYTLVHLPLAEGQEEERANPFQEIAFSNGNRCVPFWLKAHNSSEERTNSSDTGSEEGLQSNADILDISVLSGSVGRRILADCLRAVESETW